MSETNDLTQLILNFFFERGIFAKRHSVSAGKAEYITKAGEVKKRYFQSGIVGGHDVFVWLPPKFGGKFLGVEIKASKSDRIRPEQEGFHKNILRMGHLSITVHSEKDFLEQINPILNGLS